MIETQTPSCALMYRYVRDFAAKTKPWQSAIRYQTKPDERFDLTLVSQRVYGRRDEYLVVMAAAALDSVEQELTERLLVLPTESQLTNMKERALYVNLTKDR